MSRNSEIVRAGVGRRVEALAANGKNPKSIATIVSRESGYIISAASVGRHMKKQSVNAAVVPDNSAINRVVAALQGLDDERDTGQSSFYGLYKLNTTNNFTTYYGLARGIKNGQVLRAFKNIALKITNGAHIAGDGKDTEKIAALAAAIDFSSLLQDVVRYTCEMGTCLVSLKTDTGDNAMPSVLPMQYYSLLTDRETAGVVDDALVHGEVTKIVFDEMGDKKKQIERDDMGLFRVWAGGHETNDISGRTTVGIYGESMTNGIETPLKSLLNGTYHWDAFLSRYGTGRMVHNFTLLAKLVEAKIITPIAAQETLNLEAAAGQKIGPNQDIYGMGKEVSMLESKTGFNILPYFEWRSKQIDRALLQSDVGAGDVSSSWTSAGTAVSAQDYDTFKSLRETLFRLFFEEIILPRLEEFNLNPKTISIGATPFLRVDVPFQTLTEWVEMGLITEAEARERGGFPAIKPDED